MKSTKTTRNGEADMKVAELVVTGAELAVVAVVAGPADEAGEPVVTVGEDPPVEVAPVEVAVEVDLINAIRITIDHEYSSRYPVVAVVVLSPVIPTPLSSAARGAKLAVLFWRSK